MINKTVTAITATILILLFLICAPQVYANAETPATLRINGRDLADLPMPPVIIDGRTLVPARETFEAVDAVVLWQAETQQIYIAYQGTLVTLQIDNPVADINGKFADEIMDVPPQIINNKTMIPLRFVSQALGFDVDWDGTARIAYINTNVPQGLVIETPPSSDTSSAPSSDVPADISAEAIPEISYPQTRITDVNIPLDGTSVFTIIAASPISKVDTFPLQGPLRIVVDIYNARFAVSTNAITVNSAIVERIRMAQQPDGTTRVVFDMASSTDYRLEISPDRTQLFVVFGNSVVEEIKTVEVNKVNEIRFGTDIEGDYVELELDYPAAVNIFHLTKPDRVVIDVPRSMISDISTRLVAGRFAYEIRTNQFDENTARIVLGLNQKSHHTVSVEDSTVTVRITEPTFRNITYDENIKMITLSKGGLGFSSLETTHYDSYDSGRYILTLPVDLSPVIGYGEYLAADDYLYSILIRNNTDGRTELVLNDRYPLIVRVSEDNANIYIQLLRPRDVYDKVVVLDPGHGGDALGTHHFGVREKDVNLAIALKTMSLLEQDGRVKVYTTRATDRHIGLRERAAFGNAIGDLFVSIHNNASDINPNANGTETFYYNHAGVLGARSKKAAEIIHRRLVDTLGSFERKVSHNNLQVIRESTVPATLLEVGFISNAEEAAKLATEDYQWLTALAIFEGIIEFFEGNPPIR